jgi:hypothetical protein
MIKMQHIANETSNRKRDSKIHQTITENYPARLIAEKFVLEFATAKTIARLAGLGEWEARQ